MRPASIIAQLLRNVADRLDQGEEEDGLSEKEIERLRKKHPHLTKDVFDELVSATSLEGGDIGSISGGYSEEAMQLGLESVQRDLEHGIQAFDRLSSKAIQIAQVNGAILAIIAGTATQVDDPSIYDTGLIIGGILLLVLSTVLALLGYSSTRGQASIDTTPDAILGKQTQSEYLLDNLPLFWDLLSELQVKAAFKSMIVQLSLVLSTIGYIALIVGIFFVHGIL